MGIISLLCLFLISYLCGSDASLVNLKSGYVDNWMNYNFVPPNFVPFNRRVKHSADVDDSNVEEDFRLPSDVEVQNDTADHKYYVLENFTNRPDMLKEYYFNVDEMLKKPGTTGNSSHPLLSNSYRRAVAVKLRFQFPFYGYRLNNLTITTGGFIYVGDQSHSWLAAAQYIAPLMANFDTQADNSTIMYADDGEKFVIEWRNLQLRTQKSDGYFTFQLSLHQNGDIWFAYKDVPISVSNISKLHHPVKLGVSDAYLFYHRIRNSEDQQLTIKRVIYEYHCVEVDPNSVTSNTVIRLLAQPTCIQYRTCEECSNATLAHFNCSWCHSNQANGGPFCSDSAGRRQHWLDSNCVNVGKITYCNAVDDFKEVEDDDESVSWNASTRKPSSAEDVQVITWNKEKQQSSDTIATARIISGPSFSWLFMIAVLVILGACWFGYAYFNPHSASGQFLIKYRPSQWRMPSSHVRYSASVHM